MAGLPMAMATSPVAAIMLLHIVRRKRGDAGGGHFLAHVLESQLRNTHPFSHFLT